MPSINLDLDYLDHPKACRLTGLLGVDSELVPIRLWLYVGKYHAEDGQLAGFSPEEVESIVKWRGPKGQAVDALCRVGFLEAIPGGYQVHDWTEHSGHLSAYKRRAKAAAKARWAKKGGDTDASSIGNAPSIACLQSTHEMSGKEEEPSVGDNAQTVRAEVGNFPKTTAAGRLGAEWFIQRGRYPRTHHDHEAATYFQELLDGGLSEDAIMDEIKRKGRRRSEPPWDFCKRMLPSNDKPNQSQSAKRGTASPLTETPHGFAATTTDF